jgi:phage shock protein PspC (stress-responsive transcriptional regulator)
MDKTININLGGVLFSIDKEAYTILRDYLLALSNRLRNIPGWNETIEDIELRIAEIFLSKKTATDVINRQDVEDMILIIGKPEDFSQAEDTGEEGKQASGYGRRMMRQKHDSIIGGVCSGIGSYLDADPVWIRIFFILMSFLYGAGLIVYLALWITLPVSESGLLQEGPDARFRRSGAYPRRGRESHRGSLRESHRGSLGESHRGSLEESHRKSSEIGKAFNETFRALGNLFWLLMRGIIILIGLSFVVAGFLATAAFIMVFVFRFPGIYAPGTPGINIAYLSDILSYVVNPQLVPWIMILTGIAVILPLLVLIYLGVKMIFWFRAGDGIFLLTGFVVWVVVLTILSFLLFNEGISFVETARSGYRENLKQLPETLYIRSASRISGLDTDNEISIPGKDYHVFIDERSKKLYIGTYLDILPSAGRTAWIDVTKRSSGRSKTDAAKKADRLRYNYRISGDTLFLDEYFTYPENAKWSFDVVDVLVNIPQGTKIRVDSTIERMIMKSDRESFVNDYSESYLIMTKRGLEYIDSEQDSKP